MFGQFIIFNLQSKFNYPYFLLPYNTFYMNYILFDDSLVREHLLPFTFTRPICEIRIGILTIREKWEYELGSKVSYKTEKYLSEKYPEVVSAQEDNIWINGSVLPSPELIKAIKKA